INKEVLDSIKKDLLDLGNECKNKASLCVLHVFLSSNRTYCGDVFSPALCGRYFAENNSYFIDCNGKYFSLLNPLKDVQEGDFIRFDSVRIENNTIISFSSFSRTYNCNYYCI
ncbi:MAG: hypothetical protein NZ942_00985, partial [Candidatus Aenigmarchaeota archaeon]|nr:hypothetical protein [Candidatus Aenigmarchaeota archaeon]